MKNCINPILHVSGLIPYLSTMYEHILLVKALASTGETRACVCARARACSFRLMGGDITVIFALTVCLTE